MFPLLSESREKENQAELKCFSNNLVEKIENKTEFVNEQKENIKILNHNVENFEIFLERLALWFYQKNCKKRIFYNLKRYKNYKDRKYYRKKIVKYMKKKRKVKKIFSLWKNMTFSNKKTRLGKEMILSFKVEWVEV
jgi:hypothetical protein